MYIEIVSAKPERDGRASRLLRRCAGETGGKIGRIVLVDSYRFDLPDFPEGGETGLLCDPIAQRSWKNRHAALDPALAGWFLLVEIAYRPGVTNPEAVTLRNALETFMGKPIPLTTPVQTARQYLFYADPQAASPPGVSRQAAAASPPDIAAGSPLSGEETDRLIGMLHNPLIERAVSAVPSAFTGGDPLPLYYPLAGGGDTPAVEWIPIAAMSDVELESLSTRRLLALDGREMAAIREYFASSTVIAERRRRGLPPEASDVELEMIAQTWSEHCKHKIFRARITYTEEPVDGSSPVEGIAPNGNPAAENAGPEVIDSLFSTYIRAVTEKLRESKGFLRSVFDDNSGVIDFDGENLLCFKVETHNSPSALDPYGGAITGIVGVNRTSWEPAWERGRSSTPMSSASPIPARPLRSVRPAFSTPERSWRGSTAASSTAVTSPESPWWLGPSTSTTPTSASPSSSVERAESCLPGSRAPPDGRRGSSPETVP
jgi:phosphoribosylformylglycinamidine synthase